MLTNFSRAHCGQFTVRFAAAFATARFDGLHEKLSKGGERGEHAGIDELGEREKLLNIMLVRVESLLNRFEWEFRSAERDDARGTEANCRLWRFLKSF